MRPFAGAFWHRTAHGLGAAVVAVAIGTLAPRPSAQQATSSSLSFAALVERLSEPGGDFGGDNLISNEQSYLHVMPALERARVSGGAYLGVGPDQNFSYIAQVKPEIAFIIDIRRDNLLLHLLFKALFAIAPSRAEYLCALTARPPPAQVETWRDASIEKLVSYIDATPPQAAAGQQQMRSRIDAAIERTGVSLTAGDRTTIRAFRQAFIDRGLSLVFQVRGQGVRDYYPSLRDLLRETDLEGRQRSYLASEPAFQVVRSLESRDLIVPVVGDVSGPKAMRAIAAAMAARGASLSAFYISNVEFYLSRDGRFPAFVENLKQLPRTDRSTMIRSVFPGGFPGRVPLAVPGYYSTSLIQPLDVMLADLASGKYRSYADLVYASSR
jgi:hypothetical protein